MEKEILNEIEKCRKSPYYFAITYLKINKDDKSIPYNTHLTEKQFNNQFNRLRPKIWHK